MGTIINFKRPDGKEASGYLANAARGDAPGVVVIQEWWGLQDQIKGMCDRFARAGFDALAPDLYKGKVVPYHDTDAAGKEMNSLDFMDLTTQTVRGAAQYLARNGARVGLTGFCLGGAVTIIGATKIPELTAGVVFYGIPPEQAANPDWTGLATIETLDDLAIEVSSIVASPIDLSFLALLPNLRSLKLIGSAYSVIDAGTTVPFAPFRNV